MRRKRETMVWSEGIDGRKVIHGRECKVWEEEMGIAGEGGCAFEWPGG